jgi:hypothetical protein
MSAVIKVMLVQSYTLHKLCCALVICAQDNPTFYHLLFTL